MRPCFKFTMSADAAKATLSILDEIGFWGVQASDFRAALDKVTAKDLDVEINSPGGDLFAGVTMYNMLKASGKTINVKVMGVAASAASLVAMAGDTIAMPKNTFMMVHNPMGGVMGNADAMRETAALLDKLGASMLATYQARTGLPEDALAEMLAVDTWMTADEALASGFATVVTDEIKATAAFDMERADLPAHIKAIYAMTVAKTPAQIKADAAAAEAQRLVDEAAETARLAALAQATPDSKAVHAEALAAGLTAHADFIAVTATSKDDASLRIKNAVEIASICAFAKRPEDAHALIRANKSVAEARTAVVNAMAAEDLPIDTTIRNNAPPASKGVSPTAYWAKQAKKAAPSKQKD